MTKKISPDQMFYDKPPTTKEEPEVSLAPRVVEKEVIEESIEHEVGNIIDLPSKGMLGYPGSISHREIYAGDEEILKSATNKNFSRTVNRVLKDICNNPEYYDDLYVGDRDYILTSIWANTYDNEKTFEVNCRHCGTSGDMTVDMFEVDVIKIRENFKPTLPLKIRKSGETLNVRLITVRDENNAEKFMADNPDLEYSFQIVQIALSLEFGRPMSVRDRVEYLKENVSAKEMGIIKEYHRYFRFGLDTEFSYKCGECKGVTRGDIPFQPQDIIAPDVRTDFEQLLHDV